MAALLGLVVAVTATVAAGVPAVAAPTAGEPAVSRLGGADRYATSAQVALTAYPDGADTVIVASGESFPDALAASPLTGVNNAPILLARWDEAPTSVLDAAAELSPQRLIVVGGVSAVSVEAAQQLAAAAGGASIERIAGTDRFATSLKAAEAVPTQDITAVQGARIALLATAERFPDALAAAPVAAALHVPLLLTSPDRLTDEAAGTLTTAGVNQVVILGGEASLDPAIDDQLTALGIASLRLGGADRQATAAMLADWATTSAGFSASRAALARGDDEGGGADALTLGALAGLRREPLLLTVSPSTPGAGTLAWFGQHGATLTDLDIAGSEAAVSRSTLAAVSSAAVSGEAPASRGDGSLAVGVTSLSPGGAGAVSVSGPDGYYTRVTSTRTLTGLAAGTYRVTAAPAAYAGGTAYPATPTTVIEVGAGSTADVNVDYANQVPTSTKVVAGAAVTSLVGDSGKQQTLTVDSKRAEPVQPGDIVGAASSAAAPSGVLGRVETVSTSDTTQTAVITPVSLTEAIPSADFSVQAGNLAPRVNTAAATNGRTLVEGIPIDASEPTTQSWDPPCDSVVKAHVQGQMSVDPTFTLDASWGPFRDTTADIGVTVTTRHNLTVEAFGALKCTLAKEEPFLTKEFPSIKFMVGWFPVILVPEMSVDATFDASLGAAAYCTWSGSETRSFGRSYRDGAWTKYPNSDEVVPVPDTQASGCTGPRVQGRLEALVGVNFDLKLYDVLGPRVSVAAGVRATFQTQDPVWAVDGVVVGSAGLVLDAFKIKQDFSVAAEFLYRVAEAGPTGPIGVCTGVPGCTEVASVDVDGDSIEDKIGLVPNISDPTSTSVPVASARVKLGETHLTQDVFPAYADPDPWPVDSRWYGSAEVDGRAGEELVVGTGASGAEWGFAVLTVRNGQLEALLAPDPDVSSVSWSTRNGDGDQSSISCLGSGAVIVRNAYSAFEGDGWTLTERTVRWNGIKWAVVSDEGERFIRGPAPELGPEWDGWHCGDLPNQPGGSSQQPSDYKRVYDTWGQRARVPGYGFAASADEAADRDRAVRACLAVAVAQDCIDKSVFLPGRDVYEAAEHDLLAIGGGQPAVLTYYPNKPDPIMLPDGTTVRHTWYETDPVCKMGTVGDGLDCDEYPYWATVQGGPGASLSLIKQGDNSREGRLLGGFATRCGLKTTSNREFITAPVVIPGDRVNRSGGASMAYCAGQLIVPPAGGTP